MGLQEQAAVFLPALLLVLYVCTVDAVAAPVLGCRHIKVKVDGRSPTTQGWRLVNHKTGRTLIGAAPGNYTAKDVNMVKCYQVAVHANVTARLELLSSNGLPWADGYLAVMNASSCLQVAKNTGGRRAVYFKRTAGVILRHAVTTAPLGPCVTKPPTPKTPLPDMSPVSRYLSSSLAGAQNYCFYANETRNSSPQKFCERQEAGIKLGCWKMVRFGVAIGNYGTAPLTIGDPKTQLTTGLFEFATCHNHYHWKGFAAYELHDAVTGQTWRTAKRGFCANDLRPVPYPEMLAVRGKRPRLPQFTECGDKTKAGHQGVSVGYMDIYARGIPGQFFMLNGGDNQPMVRPNRTYYIRITANPGFWRGTKNYRCRARDYHGLCHPFAELDYDNNVMEVPFSYTA